MYKERSKFELYLELLTQVKSGNCDETMLMNCTNLPQGALHTVLNPLLSEKLLKSVITSEGQEKRLIYILTDKGDQFIDLLGLGINFAELKSIKNSD